MMYYVYILMKNERPVYVGMSKNIEQRIKTHRSKRPKGEFDGYSIFFKSKSKQECLLVERSLIKFSSLYENRSEVLPLNAKYENCGYKSIIIRQWQDLKEIM